MTNPTDQRPTPLFAPSIGRQVQYALKADEAESLTQERQNVVAQAIYEAQYVNNLSVAAVPPLTYAEGDFVSATITHVHSDGTADLTLMPSGSILFVYARANAYGPGGYLYFNQIPPQSSLPY